MMSIYYDANFPENPSSMKSTVETLTHRGEEIAYTLTTPRVIPGHLNILFLSGFRSSMWGNKAQQLSDWAPHQGWSVARFDYRGHGQSTGHFSDFTLADWLEDAEQILQHCFGDAPVMLIGSSMGGWLSYHLALRHPQQVQSIITIASAPDFITRLFADGLSDAERTALRRDGKVTIPKYADRALTQAFFDVGERMQLLNRASLPIHCPVYALHGLQDAVAPWQHSITIAERIESKDGAVELIKTGDHRLSTPADLQRLFWAIHRLQPII